MADQDEEAKRVQRQTKLFNAVIHGHRQLKSAPDANRFLEALCVQEDSAKCVECLVAATEGLSAVAKAFRFSRDSAFLNGPATAVITRLSDPSLKQLYGGEFLLRVLEAIVEPPTFWNSLCEAHHARILGDQATQCFAWLLVELLCATTDTVPDVQDVANRVTENESLIKSTSLEARNLGHKIKHLLDVSANTSEDGPGGRHDNDFSDFKKIKILPTPDEFASSERPFFRRADAIQSVPFEERELLHLDNQFRLLREDFLGELRNDFQVAAGQKMGRKKFILSGLKFADIDCGTSDRRKPCSLRLYCSEGIPAVKNLATQAARKQYFIDHKNLVKNLSLGCLISKRNVLAFASIERDEDLLARRIPVLVVRIDDDAAFRKVLFASKTSSDLHFMQVDTAVFAYELVLKCLQTMSDIPLAPQLLNPNEETAVEFSNLAPTKVVSDINEHWNEDLRTFLGTRKSVRLDSAQAESLLTGLVRKVALIQGPPGTGKSFIGALLAKILHDNTDVKILVQTYTNHALDQFLEDLLDIGIPPASIVRLGSKYTAATKQLSLFEQGTSYRTSRTTWAMIDEQKSQAESYHYALLQRMVRFGKLRRTGAVLLDYLEFSEDSEFFDAFTIPESGDGMTVVGKDGKSVDKFYLVQEWSAGRQAGVFKEHAQQFPMVWSMSTERRQSLIAQWYQKVLDEHISEISNLRRKYDDCQRQLAQLFRQRIASILSEKRIIGCTTTAAAMYTEALRAAAPDVVLVEEAGEILESHTLTAMTPNTKQLILIGDHKQLRPKVNNYELTVEKGNGYDLNVSMFERLVSTGIPHTVLKKQHRMRPEISSLVRMLTYPELEDAPATLKRPSLRGCQNNIIFISHDKLELNAERIADRRDEGSKTSRENQHEVAMVLKIVKYLGQQGYGTENIAILTPYLGQLFLLQRTLSLENDPILNDLDSFELIRAGLLTTAAGVVGKRKIKISTIDNYQGEESDIIIASLTRSNAAGDIGFMSSPQRVNVLLSRARDALIMIGNADTFMNSRKGKETWTPLMEQLKQQGHIYEGFPVKCEQHPDKEATLVRPEEFEKVCPDGGCSEPCGKMLSCAQHKCPQMCHQLQDHSKMKCTAVVTSKCPQSHTIKRECHDIAAALCHKCEAEAHEKKRRQERNFKLDQERQIKQAEYARKLAEIKDEVDHQKRLMRDRAEDLDRQNALSQQQEDLANLKQRAKDQSKAGSHQAPKVPTPASSLKDNTTRVSGDNSPKKSSPPADTIQSQDPLENKPEGGEEPDQWLTSEANDDWQHQKDFDGAHNAALDELMNMIGLESVKQQFLTLKNKVDTLVRQDVSLKNERFGASLLGNPGTGKTTVARLYAKFLVEIGALPGSYFHETSGSKLANEGVTECKNHIEKILNEGGGVMFIDEAYQLTSGNSYGGKAVLDYLLAEIEDYTGKIVFVFAGYRKEMETFFAHNPGIPSRISTEMDFQDYADQELREILCQYINSRYKGSMKVDDGFKGLYVRIVARRIGSGRGRDGFGNAREVQNRLAQITERQAKRLRKERRAGKKPDDHFLTKEDLIGPEPAAVLKNNGSWNRLQKLIGLESVKDSVRTLLEGIQFNYQRELEEKPLVQYSLNRCFIGSPGTGKTSVAKLYGRILADIGLLSNGEVVVKNPSDFIGSALGQSESNTKAILASTVGKVLVLDEAYGLNPGTSSHDPYKTSVIDTLVAEIQSVPGEDRCILLLGYKDQMEEMFRDVNPGLARRFPLGSAFEFEDFTDADLRKILDLKLKDTGFDATKQAKQVAMEMLKRARNQPNFGNAGEVDIILDKAKALHQKHLSQGKSKNKDTFDAIDFDPDFDRAKRAATNLPLLFRDTVGCEDIIKQLQGYQTTAANMTTFGMDPRKQIPFNFLFKGPPGTGKTTTALKMGKVYYDMGFLSHAKVENCSATDMIAQYIGQTGPKVQKLLDKALGKVLFVDEAYRLGQGHFSTEAMDELVDCLTKPKYAQKLIVILAGYSEDMDRLMAVNPGLTSRFPESVIFKHMEPDMCLELLIKTLEGTQKKQKNATLDLSVLTSPSYHLKQRILELFEELVKSKSWGNARDVKTLAKNMFNSLISTPVEPGTSLVLTENIIFETMETMLDERSRRSDAANTSGHGPDFPTSTPPLQPQQPAVPRNPPVIRTKPSAPCTEVDRKPKDPVQKGGDDGKDKQPEAPRPQRDLGVSDAVWHQLQQDKMAAIQRDNEYKHLQRQKRDEEKRIIELERREKDAAEDEEKRRLEQERIKALEERRRKDEELAAMERERQRELEAQKKLRGMGVCPAGFQWIKQGSGYRCAGGYHYVSNQELGM